MSINNLICCCLHADDVLKNEHVRPPPPLRKNAPSPPKFENKRPGANSRMNLTLGNSCDHVIVIKGKDRKIVSAVRTNQIAGFITMPSHKKIILLSMLDLAFPTCSFLNAKLRCCQLKTSSKQ